MKDSSPNHSRLDESPNGPFHRERSAKLQAFSRRSLPPLRVSVQFSVNPIVMVVPLCISVTCTHELCPLVAFECQTWAKSSARGRLLGTGPGGSVN